MIDWHQTIEASIPSEPFSHLSMAVKTFHVNIEKTFVPLFMLYGSSSHFKKVQGSYNKGFFVNPSYLCSPAILLLDDFGSYTLVQSPLCGLAISDDGKNNYEELRRKMLFSIFDARKLSFLLLSLFVWISLRNQTAETTNGFDDRISAFSLNSPVLLAPSSSQLDSLMKKRKVLHTESPGLLEYDFYRESCPNAEQIIRGVVKRLYQNQSNVAQELLRLAFHDCFIEGCDGSLLLDDDYGMDSEKQSPQNQNLKGFDLVNLIKSEVEALCPGVVSCSDILVLAARDGVSLAGGPYYPVCTGRRDGSNSFSDLATDELPSPYRDMTETLNAFMSRGFHEREAFILLGALSFGSIHCKYFLNRLNIYDSNLDMEFLDHLRSKCYRSRSFSSQRTLSSYFSPRETKWVKAYASALPKFRRDFALAMMKLSNLRVLTQPMGQIRLNCSQVA